MLKAKKGMRVEFPVKGGQTWYGVVLKGGSKNVTIILDGGEKQITGPASAVRLSDKPMPQDVPSDADAWSVVKYKDTGYGDETPQFSAIIKYGNTEMIHVSNAGQGGPNRYSATKIENRCQIAELMRVTKSWAEQFGLPMIEPEDTWVEWAGREKIYGKTAAKYAEEYAGLLN